MSICVVPYLRRWIQVANSWRRELGQRLGHASVNLPVEWPDLSRRVWPVIQLKDGQSPCNVYSVPNVFQVPIFFFPETLRTFNFCSESRLRPLPELPVLGSLRTGAEVSRTAKQCTLGTEIVVQPVGTGEVLGSSLNYSNSLTSLTVTSHWMIESSSRIVSEGYRNLSFQVLRESPWRPQPRYLQFTVPHIEFGRASDVLTSAFLRSC